MNAGPPDADLEPPPQRPGTVRRTLRLAWRIARIPLFVYAGLTLVLAAFQTSLIFPGRASQGRAEARFAPPPGAELVSLRTPDGTRIAALFGPALFPDRRPRADAPARPTILFFYGNAMCLATALDQFERFRRLGANVLIPDYPGYGLSGGRPGEEACYAAAQASYDYLKLRPDVDPTRIIAAGWSLGGAVAIDLATRRPVAGLAAFSTFTRLAEAAAAHFPLLPHALLLIHRFESDRKIGHVRCPILLGHGERDAIIPAAMMRRLAEQAAGPVEQLAVPGADHNDFFEVGRGRIDAALGRFIAARAETPASRP